MPFSVGTKRIPKRLDKDFRNNSENCAKLLKSWASECADLCALGGWNYDEMDYSDEYKQFWYLLRLYPSYVLENYVMLSTIKKAGLKYANVASMGCGAMVDAVALSCIFKKKYIYRGYDKHKWAISGTHKKRNKFIWSDPCHTSKFDSGTNIFIFSKSILNFDTINCFKDVISRSKLSSKTIYICATYSPTKIEDSRPILAHFSDIFMGYKIREQSFVNGRDMVDDYGGSGIVRVFNGFMHHGDHTAYTIYGICNKFLNNQCNSQTCHNRVARNGVLCFTEWAYELIELRKTAS